MQLPVEKSVCGASAHAEQMAPVVVVVVVVVAEVVVVVVVPVVVVARSTSVQHLMVVPGGNESTANCASATPSVDDLVSTYV